jgi:hypothetical protein
MVRAREGHGDVAMRCDLTTALCQFYAHDLRDQIVFAMSWVALGGR